MEQIEKLDQEIIDMENMIMDMSQCCRTFEDYEILKEWQDELKSKQLQRRSIGIKENETLLQDKQS